jgi:glycosyltransferase 2 family protein
MVSMSKKERLGVLLGLVLSAVFLIFAFRGLNPGAVLDDIRRANPILIAVGAVWYFAAVTVISLRWQFLLRSARLVPLRALTQLTCIGYMGNNVYPLRAGEVLRLALLSRTYKIPFARAAMVTITERAFDGIVMVTFVLVGLTLLDLPNPTLRTIAGATAPLFIVALIVFFGLAARPALARRLLERVAGILPEKLRVIALKLGDEVLDGLEALRTPKDLAGTVLASYACWMLEASVYWIVAFAMGLEASYPLMLVVVGVVNLAGLLPASPGQVGVFEFFVMTVLTAAGFAEDAALAYALVVHVVIWLPVTVVGFVLLARRGLGLGDLRRAREIEAQAEAGDMESKAVAG